MLPALYLIFSAILPFLFLPIAFHSPTRVQPSLPGHAYACLSSFTNIIIPTTDTLPPAATIQFFPSATSTSESALETFAIAHTASPLFTAKMTTDIIVYVPSHDQMTDIHSILAIALSFILILIGFIFHHSATAPSSPATSPSASVLPVPPTSLTESVSNTSEPVNNPPDSPSPFMNDMEDDFEDAYISTSSDLIKRCVDQSNVLSDSTLLVGLDTTATTTTTSTITAVGSSSSVPDLKMKSNSNIFSKLSSNKPIVSEHDPVEQLLSTPLSNTVIGESTPQPLIILSPPSPGGSKETPTTLGYQGWPGIENLFNDPLNITAGLSSSPAAPPPPNKWSPPFQPIIEKDGLSPDELFDLACIECYSFSISHGRQPETLAPYDPFSRFDNEAPEPVFNLSVGRVNDIEDPPVSKESDGSVCDAILANIMSSIRADKAANPLDEPSEVNLPDSQPALTNNNSDSESSLSNLLIKPEKIEHPLTPPVLSPLPSQHQSPLPSSQDPPALSEEVVQVVKATSFKSKLKQPTRRPLAVALILGKLFGPPSKLRQPTPRPSWVNTLVQKYGTVNQPRYPSAQPAPRRVVLKTGASNIVMKKTTRLTRRVV